MNIRLSYHQYSYYPYERVLAAREAAILLCAEALTEHPGELEIHGGDTQRAERLTYFARYDLAGHAEETVQARLERAVSAQKRQATRYSVHGLHEYKGKFNPQIAKALLNICGIEPGSRVLDPFCGSGTSLVEAAHLGADAVGYDINPFAVFLANAKLTALRSPVDGLERELGNILTDCRKMPARLGAESRDQYLASWFSPAIHQDIETLREAIQRRCGESAPIFLVLASNLLRDYSQQDPKDLRIRRRTSPLPDEPLDVAFAGECKKFFDRLGASQEILGTSIGTGHARTRDTTLQGGSERFDAAITSPPYAMALPYVDTQRLSLVWLGLIDANGIHQLESTLVGSRELRGNRSAYERELNDNALGLPTAEIQLCRRTQKALSSTDGFRRRAVPALLYRYFGAMQASFRTVLVA